jgi:hypothetical protein
LKGKNPTLDLMKSTQKEGFRATRIDSARTWKSLETVLRGEARFCRPGWHVWREAFSSGKRDCFAVRKKSNGQKIFRVGRIASRRACNKQRPR